MSKTSVIARRRAQARASDDPDYRLRRSEVNDAAIRIFRRKGYRATTLQDIANEMGMDRASLYYYTSGKDELYQDIVAEAVLGNVLMVEELATSAGPADKKLAAFIHRLMASYERHYPYLFVFVQEDMASIEEDSDWNRGIRQLVRRFDDGVRSIVQQGIEEGTLVAENGDARILANGIIGMLNWSHRWFHPKREGDSATISAIFSAMLLKGLSPVRDV